MMGHAGFDAVVIDWQRGVGVSQESVVACIQAIGSSDAVPIVRLPRNSPEHISYVLDAGAYGVIVPMVNTYEEAEAAGRACRYAPRGCRSIAEATGQRCQNHWKSMCSGPIMRSFAW